MHEMSIAVALIREVLRVAAENNLERVETVEVEVGELQLVVAEALESAFAAASRGTPAEGAVLKQETVPLGAVCRACSAAYAPALDRYQCPECGRAEAEITAGREILLRSLSGPEKSLGEAP